jgi:Ca-activated chloride channel family protein
VGVTDVNELAPMVKGGAKHGVTTSCMGFDDGYDEQLLSALADAGAGNDYWCDGPDQAATVFAAEFGGLASVVAQNVSVEVTPSSAVAATEVLNEFPITEMPNGLQVALGDAYGGEHRKVVAKFHLRPTTEQGTLEVATLTLRWASTSGDVALHTVTLPVRVTVGDGDNPDLGADDGVTEEVTRLQVARHRKEARDAAERGDFSTASALLAGGADLLACMPGEAAAAAELRADARNLGEGLWSARDAKRQYSRSRSATRGRRTDFEHPEVDPEEGPA